MTRRLGGSSNGDKESQHSHLEGQHGRQEAPSLSWAPDAQLSEQLAGKRQQGDLAEDQADTVEPELSNSSFGSVSTLLPDAAHSSHPAAGQAQQGSSHMQGAPTGMPLKPWQRQQQAQLQAGQLATPSSTQSLSHRDTTEATANMPAQPAGQQGTEQGDGYVPSWLRTAESIEADGAAGSEQPDGGSSRQAHVVGMQVDQGGQSPAPAAHLHCSGHDTAGRLVGGLEPGQAGQLPAPDVHAILHRALRY